MFFNQQSENELMSIARTQQIVMLTLAAVICCWIGLASTNLSAAVALAGALAILFGYAVILAAEFTLLAIYGTGPAVRRPTWIQVVRAWWGEVVCTPRVFCWHQPWRSRMSPDWLPPSRHLGVVLVHGFFCNRGFWNPWMVRLRSAGIPYVAVDLEPLFGSIDSYSDQIENAVRRVEDATGRAPVVVAHSMGGLAVRWWMAGHSAGARIQRVFTMGTPHRGTWLARFSAMRNGAQMRMGSDWLDELTKLEGPNNGARFVCYHSNCDNIVFPATSATLPGADNRSADGLAHVRMAFHPRVMEEILSEIKQLNAEPDKARVSTSR